MRKKRFIALVIILFAIIGAWYTGLLNQEAKPKLAGEDGVRVGKALPEFSLNNLEGQNVSVGGPGKITVINFWATWCPPCREEMPELERFFEKNQQKIQFYAINLQESQGKVQDFMYENKYTMPVLLDANGIVAKQFQIAAIPTTIIVDKNGLIKHRQSGPMTMNELEGIINSL